MYITNEQKLADKLLLREFCLSFAMKAFNDYINQRKFFNFISSIRNYEGLCPQGTPVQQQHVKIVPQNYQYLAFALLCTTDELPNKNQMASR
ncbi:hypothetical protein L484_027721 [Morus notabilis]|uniref:Uncharacterized protein n=1 Tax=Morus notabilis TaxID=981085 RepID=W9S1K4_9ROSA|nr:hypothetical protein L484_027721 [Morus notabilis]